MKRILIPLGLLLTACNPAPTPQPETGRPPDPAFETYIQATDKARAVENQMQDAAEAQRRKIDEAEQH